MLHFEHTQLLWLLLSIPLLTALWIWLRYADHKRMARFADSEMLPRLLPDASGWRPIVKFTLAMLALAFLIIALANPQAGTRLQKGERSGSDISICLDISNSMMAEDVAPNRLERAKRIVLNIMNDMAGDRVSLIVFAGTSFTQMPLTNDYSAARLFLDQVDCSLIEQQGTAIGDAIERAMTSLGYGDEEHEWHKSKNRAIVVVSDGENFEDDAIEAASQAADQGVRVLCVGMGSPKGGPIPIYNAAHQRIGYKEDAAGQVVTSVLDEGMLSRIASAGNGVYVRAGNINSSLDDINNAIASLDKENFGQEEFAEYESQYQYPLAAAMVCLIIECLIFVRHNRKLDLSRWLQRSSDNQQ